MSRFSAVVSALIVVAQGVEKSLLLLEGAVLTAFARAREVCDRAQSVIASNHVTFAAMKGSDARTATSAAEDALAAMRGTGFLPAVAAVALGGLVVFAALASGTGEPVMLTAMAILATIGVFFLIAFAAGFVRVGGRTSESDLAAEAADAIADGVLVLATDGTPRYTNRTFREFLGTTSVGNLRSLEEALAHEPKATQALFRLARAAERGAAGAETFSFARADEQAGSWLRLSVTPGAHYRRGLRDTVWQLCDVTAERQQFAQVADGLARRLASFDAVPAGLLAVTDDGIIEHANTTLKTWLGITGEPPGRSLRLSDLVSVDTAELMAALVQQRSGSVQPIDVDLRRADGSHFAGRLLVAPRTDATPRGRSFVAAVTRRNIEPSTLANLKTSGARFSRLFDTAPFGIALVGKDGRITSANRAFSRLLLANGKVEGLPALSLLGKEAMGGLRAPIETALASALAQKSGIPPVDVTVGEAGEFTRRILMTALTPAAGGGDVAVLYVLDATEQKTLEVNYAQSQKMEAVGKLAGGIAHDFNNVLTAIIGFSDLLLQTHRPSDAAYKNISAIKSSANRAAGMVSQLLAFSRRQTLQPEVLQLGETLGDLSVLLNRLLGEKIDLKIHQGRDLWYVKADRSQLSQVIINLAVNARDAMADGGTLRISTRNLTERESQKIVQPGFVVGEYVVIDVEDTGHGMTPEVMAKIFEPFFTTKGVGKGTGLGLSTVYGIVKQTGGFIFPESGPGRGTTFRVYLPRHHADTVDEIVPQKAARKERAADLTGTGCVLLVEDEDAVRGFAVEALKRQGYEVLQAGSGVEALEVVAAATKPIDLVVSDVIMPEMDGPTLLKELRSERPELKFVFMSGYPDDAFKNTLDPNTEFAFLQKPFSLNQLATKVKEQLGRWVGQRRRASALIRALATAMRDREHFANVARTPLFFS